MTDKPKSGYVPLHPLQDLAHPNLPEGTRTILEAELAYLHQRRRNHGIAVEAAADNLTGLALSGGGIRSASVCLGAIQALAAHHRLHYFDYVSSVSGGGYTHAALQWWLSKAWDEDAEETLERIRELVAEAKAEKAGNPAATKLPATSEAADTADGAHRNETVTATPADTDPQSDPAVPGTEAPATHKPALAMSGVAEASPPFAHAALIPNTAPPSAARTPGSEATPEERLGSSSAPYLDNLYHDAARLRAFKLNRIRFGLRRADLPFTSDDHPPARRVVCPDDATAGQTGWVGAQILDHLRRHGRYLVPGGGVNIITLAGVILRAVLINTAMWLPFVLTAMLLLVHALPLGPVRFPVNGVAAMVVPVALAAIFLTGALAYGVVGSVAQERHEGIRRRAAFGWRTFGVATLAVTVALTPFIVAGAWMDVENAVVINRLLEWVQLIAAIMAMTFALFALLYGWFTLRPDRDPTAPTPPPPFYSPMALVRWMHHSLNHVHRYRLRRLFEETSGLYLIVLGGLVLFGLVEETVRFAGDDQPTIAADASTETAPDVSSGETANAIGQDGASAATGENPGQQEEASDAATVQWAAITSLLVGLTGLGTAYVTRLRNLLTGAGLTQRALEFVAAFASFAILYGIVAVTYQVSGLLWEYATRSGGNWLFTLLPLFAATGVAMYLWFRMNINYVSIHRVYRDRLMEAFMPGLVQTLRERIGEVPPSSDRCRLTDLPPAVLARPEAQPHDDGGVEVMWREARESSGDGAPLATAAPKIPSNERHNNPSDRYHEDYLPKTLPPYPLINTNVVMINAMDSTRQYRGGDNFILSPLYCGSNATGWQRTYCFPENGPTLASAVAISGAAANPHAGGAGSGPTRNRLVAVIMMMFNLRLGQWLVHPRYVARAEGEFAGHLQQYAHNSREVAGRWDRGRRGLAKWLGRRLGPSERADALIPKHIFPGIASLVSLPLRRRTEPIEPIDGVEESEAEASHAAAAAPGFLTALAGDIRHWWHAHRTHHEDAKFQELTDGGHFEQLGLYELIRRRCRLIVAIDAGHDPDFGLGDLLVALRRAEQDFAVHVDKIYDASGDEVFADWDAFARSIKYESYGGPTKVSKQPYVVLNLTYADQSKGRLYMLKSTLIDTLPMEVFGYRAANADFPYETTRDQFFEPAQFDAYRRLGYHLMETVLMREVEKTVPDPDGSGTRTSKERSFDRAIRCALCPDDPDSVRLEDPAPVA